MKLREAEGEASAVNIFRKTGNAVVCSIFRKNYAIDIGGISALTKHGVDSTRQKPLCHLDLRTSKMFRFFGRICG